MRKTVFAEGELYHLYNRGVDKRVIFTKPSEYERFIKYLYLLNTQDSIRPLEVIKQHKKESIFSVPRGEPLVAIGAFCLMPNHIHLLVTPLVEGGISRYMQRVQTAYTMYFNAKHERSGALFQSTFKSEHAGHDTYAKYLYSYIHLNPAKLISPLWRDGKNKDFKAIKDFVRAYQYSSLGEYITGTHVLTDPSKFPEYFLEKKDIDDHIGFWLSNERREV